VNEHDLTHKPVLFDEVVEALQIRPDGVYVDGTFGRGGHASAILQLLNEQGRLIVMDKDPQAVDHAQRTFAGDRRVTIIHDDYARMKSHIADQGLTNLVDGILLDLGVSSPQLDNAQRGFSFQQNGPLDMRMDPSRGIPASQWLMSADEKEIADVLWRLGEERFSRRIAKHIVDYRKQHVIQDTATLAQLVSECVPAGKEKKHPATRTFQAIRIRINQELDKITEVLESVFDILKIGGRLLVISFHSLEDRLVKRFLRQHSTAPKLPKGLPIREQDLRFVARFKLIGKAVRAGAAEVIRNPRSRSAILRIAERVA
jgi:16S rRNA (cytosine1402-N4)-methyltransferase